MKLDDTLENYLRRVSDFHGCFRQAPGLIIGCYMVEYAMELLGDIPGTLNAVTETRVCLSDCIQVMTGCTLGNKHLRLADHVGRFALTLYDRDSGQGVRVYLDVAKLDPEQCPELRRFHLRQRDPRVNDDMALRKRSGAQVLEEFRRLGRGAFSFQRVRVHYPRKDPMDPSVVCPQCGEPYLTAAPQPGPCPACSGQSYYSLV
ncbi:MAG: hypothetical protein HY814_09160 [Candidatus Riflebacteria bacterium]|nr:hypothetical protein [Candidatus Riflebacteria bacterium]